jgi:tRNA A-37 threonylcarbamoyl transferase component Bud32
VIAAGGILAGYRIDGVVGRGATATVFAATELAGARRVALKVLAPHLQAQAGVRARFREAARRQQSLEHANVLDVHDVVESGGELFLVVPLVEGTLAGLIEDGELGDGRALQLLGQVADAIDFAHAAGVVHGDVKPGNVLVGDGDVAYLTDFGLATAVSGSSATASPTTIDYSAPERLRGESASARADVYALACVLYECITGAVPYDYETAAAVVGGHLFDRPPRPSRVVPGMPAELDELLARGLAKDPAERPASARQLVDAAESTLGPIGSAVLGPPPARERHAERPTSQTVDDPVPLLPAARVLDTREPRVSPWAWIAVAGALLAAVLLGTWLGARGPEEAEARPPVAMPIRHLAHSYNSAMQVLHAARASGLETFAKAGTRRGQARAATGIAVAYRTTSASLRRAEPPPSLRRATEELVRAIDRAGVGYTRLARAARRGDAGAYSDARGLIVDAETEIRRARADLRGTGEHG